MELSFIRRFMRNPDSSSATRDDASFAVTSDDPLVRAFAPWGERLSALGDRLALLNGSTEEEFLAIGARLHDFYARAGEIELMSRETADLIMGEEIARNLGSLQAILDRMSEYLANAESEAEQSTRVLETIQDQVNRVDEPLDGFKKIIKNLHMLSTAVKIESARLGEGAAGFNTLAEDVERLSVSIREKSANILAEKGSLGTMIEGTLARVSDVEAGQRGNARLIIDKTRESLATLTGIHGHCSDAAGQVAALSADIASSIAEVVTSLQFHDITRQQIEHVQEAMDDMAALLAAGKDDPARTAGEVADVCGLQEAQLGHARDELVSAVRRVAENLRDIARMETRVSDEARGMAGIADQAGHSFFAEMESGMSRVTEVLSENASASRGLGSAMASVVASVGDIAAFVTDIEEIGSEIELIALNSQVKAANTGEGGAALGVLAEAIQDLSGEARTRTVAVSEMLRKVTEATASLSAWTDEESGSAADEVEGVVEELKGLLGSVRGVNERLLALLGRMDGAVRELSADIEAATSGVTVHETVGEVIGEAMGELRELVGEIRRLAPAVSSRDRDARLRELAERYTMHSERKVHNAVFGKSSSVPLAPGFSAVAAAAAAGGEGLGDNVELF